ncbi:LysR family transcriptional regulator [Consotaella aegiceratis]|uniref:LysR family transcriptional regulator n=1 Tax=Consotaella aegiceratis TaxID=3097961 RepID=UPI002F426C60
MIYQKYDINVFIIAVEENGFSAAARRLNLDPSTVSKVISRLEEQLEVRLINRNSRHLALTEEGRVFYSGCKRAVGAIEDAAASVLDMRQKTRGKLRIFVSSTIAESRIGPNIERFHSQFPDIDIEFHLQNGYVDPIEAGIDLTISHERPDKSSFVMRRIGRTRLRICASPGFVRRHGRPVIPQDLRKFECLLSTREVFNDWSFERNGETCIISVGGRYKASQGSMLRQLALRGIGIAQLSSEQVERDIATGKLIPLLEEFESSAGIPIFAVYHDRRHLNARVRHFVDFLAEICSRDSEG